MKKKYSSNTRRQIRKIFDTVQNLLNQNKVKQAIYVLTEACKIFPDNIGLMGYQAEILMAIKLYDNAIEIYKKILELDPQNPAAYHQLGMCLYEKKPPEYSEAERMLKKCLQINPEYHIMVYFDLSQLYLRIGRVKDAIEILKKGLKIETLKKQEEYKYVNSYFNSLLERF